MNTPLYVATQAGFVLLAIIYISLLLAEIRKGINRTEWQTAQKKNFFGRLLVSILIWAAFVSIWSLSGMMQDFSRFPFNFLPILLVPIIALVILMKSKRFGQVLRNIPPSRIIRLQSFRFFVEVLLWMLFVASLLPEQMTFEGRNFDILAGISAPVIAALVARKKISRTGVMIWNVVCLALLVNIVTIAILSTPSPWRVFTNEPANYVVTHFPVCLLPGLLVPLAYYLQFFSMKQSMQKEIRLAATDKV